MLFERVPRGSCVTELVVGLLLDCVFDWARRARLLFRIPAGVRHNANVPVLVQVEDKQTQPGVTLATK
jgi:hypothetical protein